MAERFVVGSFSEPGPMLTAVATLRGAGVAIHDVFAPYPVHGLDQAGPTLSVRGPLTIR